MAGTQSASLLRTNAGFVRRLARMCMRCFQLSRLAVALVFTIAALPISASINSRALEHEAEILAQAGSEEEHRQLGFDAATPRRLRLGGPLTRELELHSAPRSLSPCRADLPRPSWERPRRSIPPDDEEHVLLAC